MPIINNVSQARRFKSKELDMLINYLIINNLDVIEKVKMMVRDGNISYEYLWYLFNKDSKYYTVDTATGCKLGSSVEIFAYKKSFLEIILKYMVM